MLSLKESMEPVVRYSDCSKYNRNIHNKRQTDSKKKNFFSGKLYYTRKL